MNKILAEHNTPTVQNVTLNPSGNLQRYLTEINKIPLLQEQEEYEHAKKWIEKNDQHSAQRLVMSHLRLVVKIASGYRGYGLPYEDLISEGNIGMMLAVKKFNPDKGARLSTYASWWIKATIQEYILRSWSLVKIGTTNAQKKLFFNLRSLKENLGIYDNNDLSKEQLTEISKKLNVSQGEIQSMNRRMIGTGDMSLQNTLTNQEGTSEWQDWIKDDSPTPEENIATIQEHTIRSEILQRALDTLKPREIEILKARRLQDCPITLHALAEKHDISKERVRQIENNAFAKLQIAMQDIVRNESLKM